MSKKTYYYKDRRKNFEIEVNLNFTEYVKADSVEEAIKKLENKYIHGNNELPREFIKINEYKDYFCQVGD